MTYCMVCDWCGKTLGYEDDYAELRVTIRHRRGRSALDARWAEESAPTRFFCASAREDTDRGGRNRAGMIPDECLDSCYDRAIAAVTGVELRDPGMGFEWRLVPLAAAAQAERDRWDKTWADMSSERRETLLFDALAGDRLVIREITERMSAALGYVPTEGVYSPRPLHGGEVTKLVNRLWRQGRLDREAETFNVNHTRYRYSRPGSVPAPTAEVVAIRREAT